MSSFVRAPDRLRQDLASPTPSNGAALVAHDATLNYVAGTLGAVISEAINVKMFPWLAKGNGVDDDRPAIQAAINANPGKIIRLPAGTYNVWGQITVNAGVKLQGDGTAATFVSQQTADVDTFRFAPLTAGATADFLNGPSIEGMNIGHTTVAPSSTQGAGVRFVQCNGYKLFNVTVNNAPEGITVQGGQFGSLKSFQVYASSGLTAVADSALLYLRQAPVGAGFQPCYTVNIEDFRFSASMLRETCIYIRNVDGAQFVNGYVAFGANSLVKVRAERDNSYVSGVSFLAAYLDCVNASSTPYGIDVPDDGYSNSFVYSLKLGSGSIIGNGAGIGLLCRKAQTMLLGVEGATILNMGKWAVDVQGSTGLTDLHIIGSNLQNTGDATSGAIRAENGRSLNIVGNTFSSTKNLLVKLNGTFTQGLINGNSNSSEVAELDNAAVFTHALVVGGNSGRSVTANGFRGLQPGNVNLDNPKALDWYEEGTFTPALNIGGASTGITYSTQAGTFTRIGNRVFYSLRLVLTSKGTATGEVNITGLPFQSQDSTITYPAPIRMTNVAGDLGASNVVGDMYGNSTSMRILAVNTSGAVEFQTPVTEAQITDTTAFLVNGSYRCA